MDKLLREISDLHAQKNELEIAKNKEIDALRDSYERSTLSNIQNMKNCQNNAK